MGAGAGSDPPFRIGLGYDSHRLCSRGGPEGTGPLIIGGVPFDSPLGPVAHSDGDALLHAVTDAILGALGLPDIGQLFPDSDPKWKGARSEVFLAEAIRRASGAGWRVGNVDATVILDAPKLGPRKEEVRSALARALGTDEGRVNIKGKTHERGPGAGPDDRIEAIVSVLMVRG